MLDFEESYNISRGRFASSVEALNQAQLNFKLHDDALTIGQMAIHVAGVEVWFTAQCLGKELDEFEAKVARCATEGSVNDLPFPYPDAEITPELVLQALVMGEKAARELFAAEASIRDVQLTSALGPVITGTGAMARMAFHPGYHHGQAYLIMGAPGFPK
ncbi:MAG: hypothetical protein JNJ45_05200 [Chthonomonas sp.]|nr:hypothetical protein [Chthonomonas sp.]